MPPPTLLLLKQVLKCFASRTRAWVLSGVACLCVSVAHAALWSTGYYPGYEQSFMPASNIDFTTLTHIIHFSVIPNSDGTLDSSDNGVTFENSTDIVTRAHAAGKSVLICVGGAGSESDFEAATTNGILPVFINNLTNFMATRNYDGVDIDWEPLTDADAPLFTNLVIGLRSALNQFHQHKLLTVAASAYSPSGLTQTGQYVMYAAMQNQFDQINIMTYDLSGTWLGATWYNSPIFDGGYDVPETSVLVPSVNGAVSNFVFYGVSPAKLGIGIAFYGYVWEGGSGTSTGGVTQPRQTWTTAPTTTAVTYDTIIASYYQASLYHWDTNAQAAWLSITNSNPGDDMFISYDDQRTCQSKVSYARNEGLGGVMIWELSQDFQSGQPQPLLSALKQALATPGPMAIHNIGQQIDLSFTSLPLGSYGVEWKSNLTGSVWNTLIVTNVTGTGGLLQVSDPGAATSAGRFYRVQTPASVP
ncbi:MAG TPA: glycoside hydrolase family 18 protein [Candidatus Sulfotelmatobacter sp.]|nr:glycoside hydrolase family 18 protein [Candidatus Sulfotelmatobacter sp.]